MITPLLLEEIKDSKPTPLMTVGVERLVIGREAPDGLTIPSSGVSREHGALLWTGTSWVFEDLGSTNGSWLNEEKLEPHSPVAVKHGDILQLGDVLIRVRTQQRGSAAGARESASARDGGQKTETGMRRPMPVTNFGQIEEEQERSPELEATVALDRALVAQLERRSLPSSGAEQPGRSIFGQSPEEKVIFIVGFLLVCGILSAAIFWMIR